IVRCLICEDISILIPAKCRANRTEYVAVKCHSFATHREFLITRLRANYRRRIDSCLQTRHESAKNSEILLRQVAEQKIVDKNAADMSATANRDAPVAKD